MRLILFLLFIMTSSLAVQAQVPDTIPFKLTEHNNISVPVILNGQHELDLMFHTAGSEVTLTEAAVEQLPDLDFTEAGKANSWGGSSDTRMSVDNSLTIGRSKQDSLRVFESKHSSPGTDGKFGFDFFKSKTVEVNYTLNALIIHERMPATKGFKKLKTARENGMFFLEGKIKINGKKVKNKFLLHSGYAGTLLLDDAFTEKYKLNESLAVVDQQILKDSYGNELITKKVILPEFKIGNTVLKNQTIGIFAGKIKRQKMSLTGGALLKQFNWIVGEGKVFIQAVS